MFTRIIVSLYPDIIVFGNYVFFSFYIIVLKYNYIQHWDQSITAYTWHWDWS